MMIYRCSNAMKQSWKIARLRLIKLDVADIDVGDIIKLFISQTRENMKKALYKTILTLWIIFLILLFIKAFNVRYEDTFREWSEVMCDIWVWNPIRWIVVAEDKKRIYIKWQSQCLMYCLDDPNLEEWEAEELWATHKYKERYDDDDVKYKSVCYRIWNNKDKMKAIINRYWRDDEMRNEE